MYIHAQLLFRVPHGVAAASPARAGPQAPLPLCSLATYSTSGARWLHVGWPRRVGSADEHALMECGNGRIHRVKREKA